MSEAWQRCDDQLKEELPPEQYQALISPLHVVERGNTVELLAPNKYIRESIETQHLARIAEMVKEVSGCEVKLGIGAYDRRPPKKAGDFHGQQGTFPDGVDKSEDMVSEPLSPLPLSPLMDLNVALTFDNFVEGDSNQLAIAAAHQVAENIGGTSYNPLLLYGGVGLGKTHLMHAIGNAIAERHPHLKISYIFAQKFMEDVVRAIEHNTMDSFKTHYQSVDVLLMDDIQFLARGPRTQEEFFHVYNRLQGNGRQIVLTCDKHPKDIKGLEKRVESRMVWGMTAPLEPPELETRVAILMKKAELRGVPLENEAAYFIAKKIKSNVRELEGALNRVVANARVLDKEIDKELIRSSLKDLIAIQDRHISIENIQKIVADYYKIRVGDLLSKSRTRRIVRPRHVAMALARELTNHSLPEIGDSFGGRDHTTVINACRKVEEHRESAREIDEDYRKLLQLLTI